MANKSFSPNDHVWKTVQGNPSEREHQEFWGDDYNWTSLLPTLWLNLDQPHFRVMPPAVNGPIVTKAAWWSGALHLLGLGLGWTDIAKGLDTWRSNGYMLDNHILRSVFNTYGSSIEGLELWLKQSGSSLISEALRDMSFHEEVPRPIEFDKTLTGSQLAKFVEHSGSGPRHLLGAELADTSGGYDMFHLSGHYFRSSYGNPVDFENEDPGWIFQDGFATVTLRRYANLNQVVRDGLMIYYGDLDQLPANFSIFIEIQNFGQLGWFSYSRFSGRFYRKSLGPTTAERDLRWHLAGN